MNAPLFRRCWGFSLLLFALCCEDAESSELEPAPLRLCSWNLERLGSSGKDFRTIAALLDEHCDGAVLLEVLRENDGAPGFDQVLEELSDDWLGVRTEEPRPERASYAEYVAVAWRKGSLEPCPGDAELSYAPDPDDRFQREPAFGCFQTPTGFDFLLGGYHAEWDESVEVIEAEVRFLDEAVQQALEAWPEENDLLLFGDYNLIPERLAPLTHLTLFAKGEGSTLSASGARSRNLYDNLLVASLSDTPELVDPAEPLDLRDEAGGPSDYVRLVSDHLPLRVLLHATLPDDD